MSTRYVLQNEQTNWLQIVHVYQNKETIPVRLAQNVQLLDEAYPKMRIDLVLVVCRLPFLFYSRTYSLLQRGEFGPSTIDKLQTKLRVPKNFMFITCPGETFNHKVADLGGVRLVTH